MKPLPRGVKDFLQDAPVCRIATVLSNGSPHVSPVCPVFDGEKMFIDVSHVGGTANGVMANRRVTVMIDDYYRRLEPLAGCYLADSSQRGQG
jgi:hypothetical protein